MGVVTESCASIVLRSCNAVARSSRGFPLTRCVHIHVSSAHSFSDPSCSDFLSIAVVCVIDARCYYSFTALLEYCICVNVECLSSHGATELGLESVLYGRCRSHPTITMYAVVGYAKVVYWTTLDNDGQHRCPNLDICLPSFFTVQ